MNTRWLILALGMMSTFNAHAQEILPNSATFDPNDLGRPELTMRLLETNSVFPGLPVLVEVLVSNSTGAALILPLPTLSKRDTPQNTLDVFFVTEKGAQRIQHVRPSFGPWKEGLEIEWPKLLRLRPGATYSLSFPLSYDWFGWQNDKQTLLTSEKGLRIFAKLNSLEAMPGSDVRRVRRDDGKSSGTIEITSRLPTGIDQTAYEVLTAQKRGWRICAPESADYFVKQEDFLFFDRFVKDHAGTAYASYAKALLAYMHSNDIDRRPGARENALLLIEEIKHDSRFLLRDSLAALERRIASSTP